MGYINKNVVTSLNVQTFQKLFGIHFPVVKEDEDEGRNHNRNSFMVWCKLCTNSEDYHGVIISLNDMKKICQIELFNC